MSELVDALPQPKAGISLAVGIQQAIADAIMQGNLSPGYRLREIPLSKHFGCSTTPVREALRRLESDGLVTLLPRRGAEVASVDQNDLEDLYETRLLLELHGARRAAESSPSEQDLAGVREILKSAEEITDSDDFLRVNNLDIDFHVAVSRLSGNEVIAELIRRVSRQIQAVRVRTHSRVPGAPKIALRYHSLIVDAIEAGKPDEAAKLMAEHINWSGEVVKASITGQEGALDAASNA